MMGWYDNDDDLRKVVLADLPPWAVLLIGVVIGLALGFLAWGGG